MVRAMTALTTSRSMLLVLLLACAGGEDADGDGIPADRDCNDLDASMYPGAEEVCDGRDNDCDGLIDVNAVDGRAWYLDEDGDGYGQTDTEVLLCSADEPQVQQAGDCNDSDPLAYPGAPENCDDLADRNCDGSVGTDDADSDGIIACEECNDADPTVFPGADEACNGADEDCDGLVDEGACNYTHAVDIQPIWDGTCVDRCHESPGPSGQLDLTADALSELLRRSRQANMQLVTPGDPEQSYLVHKLRGTHLEVGGSGGQMPRFGELPLDQLSRIEAWILDGAAP